jgi:TPR repeat protein
MRKPDVIGGLIFAAFLLSASSAQAGPWEDGMAAYNRGDYLPAIRLFRPLAENGNRKAQNVIGAMYSKGEGVQRNASRALMWFTLAAKRGDAQAKARMREVSKTMAPAEISQAEAMAQACEASDYRACEY